MYNSEYSLKRAGWLWPVLGNINGNCIFLRRCPKKGKRKHNISKQKYGIFLNHKSFQLKKITLKYLSKSDWELVDHPASLKTLR